MSRVIDQSRSSNHIPALFQRLIQRLQAIHPSRFVKSFYVALSKSIEMKRLFTSLKYISIGLNHILDAWVAKVNLGIFRHVSPFSQIYCFHLNVDVLVHLVSYECVCPCSSVLLRRGFNHTIFWLIC